MNWILTSSLEKIVPGTEQEFQPLLHASMLQNETYCFSVMHRLMPEDEVHKKWFQLEVESDLQEYIKVSELKNVPMEMPAYPTTVDEDYLTKSPALVSDVLWPMDGKRFYSARALWRGLWFTVSGSLPKGVHNIIVRAVNEEGLCEQAAAVELEVIGAKLPKQELVYTNWFHCDCLAKYYKVPMQSERHWELIEQYMKCAARFGVNMILTPVFTPPLDTAVGTERPTMQLVDVYEDAEGRYSFSFEKLGRFLEISRRAGMEYFEISHLYTQWGAAHAPKIMVTRADGEYNRKFGWDTDAFSDEYKAFLRAFLSELVPYLKSQGVAERCYFHISDEPSRDHMENYRRAREAVEDLLKDFPIIDALSDYEFYQEGLVKKPIPSNDHITPFLENHVPNLWTYYCCGQGEKVGNRFLAMPSYRNRILGCQLYKYDIEGFLHWGFNFWFSHNSGHLIDPFTVTDGENTWPAGDPFTIYPGEAGPVASQRIYVFLEALQDLRAFRLLESFTSKEHVLELIEQDGEVTFFDYPRNSAYLLSLREMVNEEIKKHVR